MKYFLYTIGFSILLLACNQEETKTEETIEKSVQNSNGDILTLNETQLKNMRIETARIGSSDLPQTIRLNAKAEVAPQNTVSITSAFGGDVRHISLIPGSSVKQGQVVVVLEDPQYILTQEDYLTTKALLEQATTDYRRQRDLNAAQAASDKVMQQAKAQMQTLQVKKASLEQRLKLMNINPNSVSVGHIQRRVNVTAPVSGMVSSVDVNMGQYVSPATPMVQIIKPDLALLNIRMFEKDLPKIEVGQSLKAFTNSEPNKKADAVITSISREVNEDGTVNVYAKIRNNNGVQLAANMYFNIELQVASSTAHVLPEEAVVSYEGKDYLFEQIKPNTFKLLPIQKGGNYNQQVEILTPLKDGQIFVTKGAYQLLTALKNTGEE